MRALGLRNPICIIPNGVDLPQNYPEQSQPASQRFERGLGVATADSNSDDRFVSSRVLPSDFPNRKVLLYHGRIHPKKGLPNLLRAWAKVCRPEEWLLAIAGWDQGGHEAELKRLASGLRLVWADARFAIDMSTSVVFPGPQFGSAREKWLQRCEACILPSFSEGLPMAVLEAWACAKPVLLTPQCNLPEGFSAEAALTIGTKPETIVAGLQELFHASSSNLDAMGLRGLALVSNSFAWPKIAADLRAVYYWMSGAAPKPDCVLTTEARSYELTPRHRF
jgi:poly(glycerol-phosphate) alpha-glucosyltransferase